jgi:hypothetical protein
MKKQNTPVVAIAAAVGAGKTTVLEVLELVFQGDPRFLILDTSAVIAWHRTRGTKLGQLFTSLAEDQKERKLMPDKPVMKAAVQKIQFHTNPGQPILKAFWGGVPRSKHQGELLYKNFEHLCLVTIDCSLEEALKADAERPPRLDGGPEKTKKAYKMHHDLAQPGIDYLVTRKRIKRLPLKRGETMATKIKAIIEFAGLGPEVTTALLNRCTDPEHPACQRIHKLDGTHAAHLAHSASPPQNNVVVEFAGVSPVSPFTGAMQGQFARPS